MTNEPEAQCSALPAQNLVSELLSALKGLMGDIESGMLVRNIADDMEPGWTMKMLGFVQRLKAAQIAIGKAEAQLSALPAAPVEQSERELELETQIGELKARLEVAREAYESRSPDGDGPTLLADSTALVCPPSTGAGSEPADSHSTRAALPAAPGEPVLDLAPIKARANDATEWKPEDCEFDVQPDGWVNVRQGARIGETLIMLDDTYENSGKDWQFIAHARQDIPALIHEVERLRAALLVVVTREEQET